MSTIDRTIIDGHTVKLIIEDLITSKPDTTPIPTLTLIGGFGPIGTFLWHTIKQEISRMAASNYNWIVSAASWRQINLEIHHYITSVRGANILQGIVATANESQDECITEVFSRLSVDWRHIFKPRIDTLGGGVWSQYLVSKPAEQVSTWGKKNK